MKNNLVRFFIVLTLAILVIGCSSNQEEASSDDKDTSDNQESTSNEQEGTSDGEVSFPEKDIQIIVPYAAGGNSDLTARIFAKIIKEEELLPGVDISVVNMVGGNTRTGLNEVLNAKSDGHTILLHHTAFNTMEAIGQLPMSYRDYEAIGQVSEMAYVYTGKKDGMNSFDEYQQAAKENPGSVTLGIPGVGGTGHMVWEYILHGTDSAGNYKTVPFQGGEEN